MIERAGMQVRPDPGPKTSHTCDMLAAPAPAPSASRREEVGGPRSTPSRVSFAISPELGRECGGCLMQTIRDSGGFPYKIQNRHYRKYTVVGMDSYFSCTKN